VSTNVLCFFFWLVGFACFAVISCYNLFAALFAVFRPLKRALTADKDALKKRTLSWCYNAI
jgi:hypothetical protein